VGSRDTYVRQRGGQRAALGGLCPPGPGTPHQIVGQPVEQPPEPRVPRHELARPDAQGSGGGRRRPGGGRPRCAEHVLQLREPQHVRLERVLGDLAQAGGQQEGVERVADLQPLD
jgi:hypothetical protein